MSIDDTLKKSDDEYDALMGAQDKVVRRHAWTLEEDEQLLQAVLKVTSTSPSDWMASQGPSSNDWTEIVRMIPDRSKKQCRERWDNKVNPGISLEEWTTQEILQVFLLHKKHGNKWRSIAMDMPGRTALQCRNCYHSQQAALRKKFPHIFADLEEGRANNSSLASAVESLRPDYGDHADGRRKRRTQPDGTVADFGVADHLGAPVEDMYDDPYSGVGRAGALLPQVEAMIGSEGAEAAANGAGTEAGTPATVAAGVGGTTGVAQPARLMPDDAMDAAVALLAATTQPKKRRGRPSGPSVGNAAKRREAAMLEAPAEADA